MANARWTTLTNLPDNATEASTFGFPSSGQKGEAYMSQPTFWLIRRNTRLEIPHHTSRKDNKERTKNF